MVIPSNRYPPTTVLVVGERSHTRAMAAIDRAFGHLQRAIELLDTGAKRGAIRRRIELSLESLAGVRSTAPTPPAHTKTELQ